MIFTVASSLYIPATYPFGPYSIPGGSTRVKLSLKRESWPADLNTPVMTIEGVVSLDGGATWDTELGRNASLYYRANGGVLPLDKNNQPRVWSDSTWDIITPCTIKGQIIVLIALRTTINIEFT